MGSMSSITLAQVRFILISILSNYVCYLHWELYDLDQLYKFLCNILKAMGGLLGRRSGPENCLRQPERVGETSVDRVIPTSVSFRMPFNLPELM